MEDKYTLRVEISGDAEKKLNADIETATKRSKQKVEELTGAFKTSSEKIIAYGKLVNDKERADQRIRVAETKSQLDIKYANVKAALDKEVIAVQGGKEMEVKAAINARKLMESELRTYEAFNRNILSKELADFKATKQAELSEQRRAASMLNNAPRTTLKGSIGSEGYTSQLMASQRKMLPGSEEFTQTGLLIERYKSKLKEAGIETEALANKTSLFRQKQINLGSDLTVTVFGLRAMYGDLKNLAAGFRDGTTTVGSFSESLGLASLQALSMTPALIALKKAIPVNEWTKGAGAVGLFSIALADIVNKGMTVVDAVKRMREGGEGFFQSIRNALSNNTIGQFTKELFGIKNAADITADALNRVALASQNALQGAQIQELNRRKELDLTPEMVQFENQFKKQTEELKRANDIKPSTGTGNAPQLKEEKSAIMELLEALSKEVRLKELRKTVDANYFTGLITKLRLMDSENLKGEEQIALLERINELRGKLFNTQPGFVFGEGLQLKEGGDVVDRIKPDKEKEKSFFDMFNELNNNVSGMVSNFAGMFQLTNLMKGEFGQIISIIQNFIGSINSGVNFVGSLLSLLPGGGAIAGIAGAASMNPTRMSFGGGSNTRIINNQPINIRGAMQGQTFLRDELPVFNSNSARDVV